MMRIGGVSHAKQILQRGARWILLPGMSTKEIMTHALKLPARSRARLAAQLLESIDARQRKHLDAAWASEAEARIAEYDSAGGKTVAAADVLAYQGKR